MSIFTKSFVNSSTGLLFLRIVLGIIMFAHGAQKVLGWYGGYGLSATVQFVEQAMGIPAPLMYLASFTEFLGGIALLLGLTTRVFASAIFIEMIVATVKVHLPVGFFMNWGSVAGRGEGFEFNLLILATALTIALLGPGEYSLDYKLFGERTT